MNPHVVPLHVGVPLAGAVHDTGGQLLPQLATASFARHWPLHS